MENWENKLNNVEPPEGSVHSHKEALRTKLQSVKPRSRMRASALIASLALVLGLTGLTVANPDWVDNVVKIFTREAHFTSADGKQEYHIQTLEIEGPADSVAAHLERMKADGQMGDWTFNPADPANAELLKREGAHKMVFVEAEVTDKGDGSGPQEKQMIIESRDGANCMLGIERAGEHEKQMIIESRDGGMTFTVNGEKTVSADELKAMQGAHNEVMRMVETTDGTSPTMDTAPQVVSTFELKQNHPNPFNPTTQIPYELKVAAEVTLKVFDMTGREVATLVNGNQNAGSHSVAFDGSGLASGTYLYTLKAGDFQLSRTMVLVK